MDDYTFDLVRIFFGELNPLFYLEIVLRTTILFSYAIFAFRVTPQRNIGELSPLHIVVIIALGSAVGDPMFYPDVPIVHGILVITLVVIMSYAVGQFNRYSEEVEKFVQGRPIRLIKNGLLENNGLRRTNTTREDVFMALRQSGFKTLGQIKRAYIETNGKISIVPFEQADVIVRSVPVIPPHDIGNFERYHRDDQIPVNDYYGCYHCGRTEYLDVNNTFGACPRCEHDDWILLASLFEQHDL